MIRSLSRSNGLLAGGFTVVAGALLLHRSTNGVLFGRYSVTYTIAVIVEFVVFGLTAVVIKSPRGRRALTIALETSRANHLS